MISGAAYALVGIKTRWLHCFFSVGFLAAVGVTVLILYVMNPPISNGIQGGYVVAAVGTGALLGGASLIFQDILECLGCLLGGFCLAMWLLTLKAGGLIGSGGAGNVIFVCVFSAAGLAGYFSRWTRGYFMIACISLSGATAAVIGIDCFSRAGLKEFWAWIWDLNPNLFPLGADTYPLTRGIRVEQAATIIIFLGGIVSQSKLWMVIKDRRAKKEEERRRGEVAMQEEEEHVGRNIESKNASERRDWDAVFGHPKSPTSLHTAHDSGMGDMDSEKKHRISGTTTTATRRSTAIGGDGIEMAEMSSRDDDEVPTVVPLQPTTAADMVMGKDRKDGMVTVRVAVDEVDPAASAAADVEGGCEPPVRHVAHNYDAQLSAKPSADQLRPTSETPVPKVVPLPFRVPTIENEEMRDDEDQSSVAAIPEYSYDDEMRETRSIESKRSSFAKRLSTGSTDLFRRLSHHSISRQLEKAAHEAHESTEDLNRPIRGDRDSVAATYDDASSADDEDCGVSVGERPFSKEIKAQLADRAADERTEELIRVKEAVANKASRASLATISTSILDVAEKGAKMTEPENSTPQTHADKPSVKNKGEQKATVPVDNEKEARPAISIVSEADSGPVGLTRDRLPGRLSRVALSYRTNEWAKHLSNAEAPALDDLDLLEPVIPAVIPIEEPSAPVNVEELQKTAETGALPPAMPRSVSVMSTPRASTRGPSNLEVPGSRLTSKTPPHSPRLDAASPRGHPSPSSRRTSAKPPVGAIVEEDNRKDSMITETRQAAVQAAAAALVGDVAIRDSPASSGESLGAVPVAGALHSRPPVRGVVSYNSPQTLIGQRDMIMRVKNQALRPDSLRGSPVPQAPGSDTDSIHTAYTTVAALGPPNLMGNPDSLPSSRRSSGTYGRANIGNSPPNDNADLDDLPLSQRRTIIRERRNSMASMSSTSNKPGGNSSRRSSVGYTTPVRADTSNSLGSNLSASQAQRRSEVPPGQSTRASQLASFRQSVQANLRSSSNIGIPVAHLSAQPGFGGGYHSNNMTPMAGPLINSVYGIPGTSSSNSLLPHQTQVWDSEVQRDLDVQRQFLISQRDAETRRRESARVEREKGHKRFETRMRTDSQLMEAHRDAMRRMQRKAT